MFNQRTGGLCGKGDVDCRIDNGEMLISIGGDFNIGIADRVREVIREGIDAGVPRMVIDMRKVDYIDSSGVGTLVMALKGIERIGGKLQVLGVPEQAKKLLRFPPFCEDGEFKPDIFGR